MSQIDCGARVDDGSAVWRLGCRLYVPLNPAGRQPTGYTVYRGDAGDRQWRVVRPGLLEAGYQARIGRIVVDASAGWLAFAVADADHVLAARFPDDATGKYPDRGWSVEAWTRARGRAARVD